jgi:OOP family OmpA-OmpF porin
MTTIRLLVAATFAALACAAPGVVSAQSKQGYWTQPAGGDAVWKNATGLCWRAGYWTPAMAIAECDPDLVPKPAAPTPVAPPPRVAPPPKPAPAPAAAPVKPKVLRVTSTELFEFNRSTLTDRAKSLLDTEVIAKLGGFATIQFININGHTDRIGSAQYNQKLSERRANAVKAYLVSKGVDGSKIETYGFGKTLPVKSCPDQRDRKALIACLEPNRRVEVEVQGTPK